MEKLSIAADAHQNVIEIVGDAGRQMPNRLHFLSLTKLRLQTPTLSNIFRYDSGITNRSIDSGHCPPAQSYGGAFAIYAPPFDVLPIHATTRSIFLEK